MLRRWPVNRQPTTLHPREHRHHHSEDHPTGLERTADRLSPEGDVFDQMAGRYNQGAGPNLGVYLKGHAGDLLQVDRRSAPPSTSNGPA